MFHVKHRGIMRICTYNIHGGRDAENRPSLPTIAASLQSVAPDLCLLQEVDRFLPRSGWEDQAARLGAAIGAEFQIFFYGRWGVGKARFGNALLSRLPVTGIRRVALPGGGEPRGAVGVTLEGGARVWSTHLGLRAAWRAAQLAALAREIGPASDEGPGRASPAILVGGDFNATLDEEGLRRFLDETGMEPLSAPEPTFPAAAPAHRIDFLFGRGWITQDRGTLAAPGSDHCLVWAALEPPAAMPPLPRRSGA
jgi:endonuclease/exonuclease/phosphatase family metal-dependent hydrolase